MRSIEETGAKYQPPHCRIDCQKGRQMMSPLIEKHLSSPRGDCGARSVVLSLHPRNSQKNESDIQENHSAQQEQLQVVTMSDTLGKCPPLGSLRGWLLTSLWCGGHISTAHCFSHHHTLSFLSNILSLLLTLSSPPAPICSHLPRLLLRRAPRTSYRPISHGEVWWQTSSFTLVRLCLSIQS